LIRAAPAAAPDLGVAAEAQVASPAVSRAARTMIVVFFMVWASSAFKP